MTKQKEQRFEKVVEYKEQEECLIGFGIQNRFMKIIEIILFIILFPIVAFVCWISEFIRLCITKRKVYWRKIE